MAEISVDPRDNGGALQWFARFADVPGIGYGGPRSISLPSSAGAHLKPRGVASASFAGLQDRLEWPVDTLGLTPSEELARRFTSPAAAWRTTPIGGERDTQRALRQLYEALTLPGTISDYHTLLLTCCQNLWSAHDNEPTALGDLEHLGLLDLKLLEIYGSAVAIATPSGSFVHVPVCMYLVLLYRREGLLYEALAIAERGQRLNPNSMTQELERLRVRVARLTVEESEPDETGEIDMRPGETLQSGSDA